jgi:hypothetical protein
MTRTELRFIQREIKIAAKKLEGAPPAVIDKVMRDAVDHGLELAAMEESDGGLDAGSGMMLEREVGLPQSPYAVQPVMPDADPQTMPRQPLIPVDTPKPRSVLLMPGDPEFAMPKPEPAVKIGRDEPLNVWTPPTELLEQGEFQKRWQKAISDLITLVGRKMPTALNVIPNGLKSPIKIKRGNIYSNIVAGKVKVEYGPDQSKSMKSEGGGLLGQQNAPDSMDAMRIERVVTAAFSIDDETVNWDMAVYKLLSDSKTVFQPRPKEIVNHTPQPTQKDFSLRDAAAYSMEVMGPDGNTRVLDVDTAAEANRQQMKEFLEWKELQGK